MILVNKVFTKTIEVLFGIYNVMYYLYTIKLKTHAVLQSKTTRRPNKQRNQN